METSIELMKEVYGKMGAYQDNSKQLPEDSRRVLREAVESIPAALSWETIEGIARSLGLNIDGGIVRLPDTNIRMDYYAFICPLCRRLNDHRGIFRAYGATRAVLNRFVYRVDVHGIGEQEGVCFLGECHKCHTAYYTEQKDLQP